ncbi:MAG: hypothetical protein F6J87_11670 [Spirulina sp. SIO3F2]|nr:hypothetical protein [Spirulina sp. SIO3F2]
MMYSDRAQYGVELWSQVLPLEPLQQLHQAAQACFVRVEETIAAVGAAAAAQHLPASYRFNPYSTNVHVDALDEFLTEQTPALNLLLNLLQSTPDLSKHCQAWGGYSQGLRSQLRLRKQYAPGHGHALHRPNQWHQDGGLRVQFPPTADAEPYCTTPLTPLLTGWLPLTPCGYHAPGLEFVRVPQTQLLHYSKLDNATIHHLFDAVDFWQPVLTPGDLLWFDRGTLHRTAVNAEMSCDRLSLEWRLFKPDQIPPAFQDEVWFSWL